MRSPYNGGHSVPSYRHKRLSADSSRASFTAFRRCLAPSGSSLKTKEQLLYPFITFIICYYIIPSARTCQEIISKFRRNFTDSAPDSLRRGILSDIISVISETKERNRGNTAQSRRRRFAEILCPDSCNTQVLLQNHA